METTTLSELEDRRDEIGSRRKRLEHRLDDGYLRIEQALTDGTTIGAWEEFWIQLLREYEAVCDELLPAA